MKTEQTEVIKMLLGVIREIAECDGSYISITKGMAWFESGKSVDLDAIIEKAESSIKATP